MHKTLKHATNSASTHKIGVLGVIASVVVTEIAIIVSDLLIYNNIGLLSTVRGLLISLTVSSVLAVISVRFIDRLQFTEDALRNSEEENRALLAALPDLMFQISQDGTFLQYHAVRPEILWLPPEEFVGKSIYEVLPKPSADRAMRFVTNAIRTRDIQRYEYQLPYEGAPHYYESRMVPLHEDRVLAIIRDITAQKHAEQALKTEQATLEQRVAERTAALRDTNVQLVHALQTRDEFMSNVSHELRTPLTAILAFSDLLQRQLYGPLTERQATAMANIKGSAQHLLNLINDLLDISKIEAGQLALNVAPVDVVGVCQDSLLAIAATAQKKNLHVSTTFDSNVTTMIADPMRLEQILINLLGNAVKFTPDNGSIGLEVRGDTVANAVIFTVWDTGIGIATDDFTRIFKPFVQLDSGLTREYGGSGLGLALVESLVEMHGGAITVESKVDAGSRFIISLPWHKPAHLSPAPAAAEPESISTAGTMPRPGEGQLVLVAEDNQFNQMALCELLLAEGFRTVTAQDGAAAIDAAREHQPDIILMDIQMPGMDGLETMRRIRADIRLQHIPIIAVTALAMPGDRERCLSAGADRYLSKPIDMAKLLAMIIELLTKDSGHGA